MMSTWNTSWRLVWHDPKNYLLNALMWTGVHAFPLLPGLVIRQIFNALTGEATLRWDYWALLALLVGIGVGRLTWLLLSVWVYVPFRFRIDGTLRQNMMSAVLAKPGAAALPNSPGENAGLKHPRA